MLIVFGTVLILVSVALIGTEKLLTARYGAVVHRGDLLSPQSRRNAETSALRRLAGPLNFLLIGSDARANNPAMGARSDTIIIVHIPATLDRAYLISIPRDLRVHIPSMPDRGFAGALAKINSSFQFGGRGAGGVQLLSATLTQLIHVRFDGAAVVDFGGFDKVVADLGGVRLCIDENVVSIHTGRVFHPGCRDMTPVETLDYLRQRETLPHGDFDRQRHQQQFLKAIFAKTFANGLAQNPIKLDGIVRTVGKSLTVDTNGAPLDQLVFTLRNIRPDSLVGIRVPAHTQAIGGISYVLPSGKAASLYAAIDEDTLSDWITGNPSFVNQL